MALGLARIFFLAVLVVLGVSFMPDEWVSGIGRGAGNAASYAKNEALDYCRPLTVRFSLRASELKAELAKAAQDLKKQALSAAGLKLKEGFGSWIDTLFKSK